MDIERPLVSEKATFSILIPFLGAVAALGPLSNDLYVPSMSLVSVGLGVTGGSVQLTMSALLIGFSVGALIYGPMSDRFGRKPVLCWGLATYVVAAVLAALSTDLLQLVAARALQGFASASAMVLSRAIILDRWSGAEASRAISWVSIFTFMTPVIAPVVGGYVAGFGFWPAVFWMQGAAGLLFFVVTLTLLPRANRPRSGSIMSSLKAYGPIIRDRQALGYMLCTALGFIGVVAFVSNSSFVFVDYFELEPYQFGYCFSAVMLGGSFGSYLNGRFVRQLGISRMIGVGAFFLALGGTASLVSQMMGGEIISLVLSCLIYIFGVGFVFSNSVARTLSRFPQSTGAASSVFGVNQFLIGGIVAAGLSRFVEPSPYPLVVTVAASGIGCALVWWGWLSRTAPESD
jgi:DHA1 family bicyclomycin/chloramphenicol resistance-like MFS transporter